MFTETELREALEHSAARADETDTRLTSRTTVQAPGNRRRRIVLPLAAAAAVAATVAGAVAVVGDRSGQPTAGNPAGHRQQQAAADPTSDTALLDLMHIGNPPATLRMSLHGAHGRQWVSAEQQVTTTNGGDPQVTLVPAGESFGGDAIPRDHPVRIDGHTGYYGYIPVNPGSDVDENTPSVWGVAFRNDRGDWVVASVGAEQSASNDISDPRNRTAQDPAAIVTAYEKLHVTFGAPGNRVAYRVGWVPASTQVSYLGQSGAFDPGSAVTNEKAGYTEILIGNKDQPSESIAIDRPSGVRPDLAECPGYAKSPGAAVCVRGFGVRPGYEQDVAQRVLDNLTVAPASDDPTDFFTVDQALGSI